LETAESQGKGKQKATRRGIKKENRRIFKIKGKKKKRRQENTVKDVGKRVENPV